MEGKSKTNELPILFGGRFYLPGGSESGALWGGLEVGMTQLNIKAWFENNEGDRDYFIDDNELEPTLVLGMGYDMGQINPHLAMHWIPVEEDGDFLALVLTSPSLCGPLHMSRDVRA